MIQHFSFRITRLFSPFAPIAGLLAASLLVAGCVSAKPLKRLKFNEDTQSGMATFLFLSKVQATGGKFPSSCVIRIKNLDHSSAKPMEFGLPENGSPILVEVTEGKYAFDDLYCPDLGTWTLNAILTEPFFLKADRLSVLSMIKFDYSAKNENFMIQRSTKSEDFLAVQSAMKKLSQLKRKALHNPYIDRDWPAETLLGQKDQKIQLKVRKEGEDSPKSELLVQRLERCEAEEQKTNAFRIANWVIRASYQGGRLASQKAIQKFHSQTEIFENCIESAIQDFQPMMDGKVEIEVTL